MSNQQSSRVLIVEDDPDLLLGLEAIISADGYQVQALPDTDEIWAQIKQFEPDVLLLDVRVDPIQGDEVVSRLDSRLEREIPAILISAADNLHEIAHEAGADCFFNKPFEFDKLLDKLDELAARN